MILYTAPQGSEEWFRARAGHITGSKIKTIRERVGGLNEQQTIYVRAMLAGIGPDAAMAEAGYKKAPAAEVVRKALAGEPVGEYSRAAKDYAFRLAVERITGDPLEDDEYAPWQGDRGNRLEPEARAEHELVAGVVVTTVGFIGTEDGRFGASADGLIDTDEGAEYKCFLSPAKLRAILIDRDLDDVRDQCQFNMAITARHRWHFGLYCPALRPINRHFTLHIIHRDEDYIDALWKDLLHFDAMVERYRELLLAGDAVDEILAPPAPAPAPAAALFRPKADPQATAIPDLF